MVEQTATLEVRRHVIVAPAGPATRSQSPQMLLHTIAASPMESWGRCWRAGYNSAHEHQGAMQVRLEREGYRCCSVTLRAELVQ